jgi:hypothetical protein
MRRNAARRPPRLESKQAPPKPRGIRRTPTVRAQLIRSHVTSKHHRLGSSEVNAVIRRVIAGDSIALLGMDRFEGLGVAGVKDVVQDVWGWNGKSAEVALDPDKTLAGLRAAHARVLDVAARSGRVAFATTRPALLPFYQLAAATARDAGARVLAAEQSEPVPLAGYRRARLWWLGDVSVVSDGEGIVSDPAVGAFEALEQEVLLPDLVVADRGFAAGAAQAGIEVVAPADADALVLGVAASRGLPVTVVPINERRAPADYESLMRAWRAQGDGERPVEPDPADPEEAPNLPTSPT